MNPDTEIQCRVGAWFGRRMAILIGLLLSVALFFLYDGFIGYPKKSFNAALFAAFQSGKSRQNSSVGIAGFPNPDEFGLAEFTWKQETALTSAIETGKKGETWSKFAAARHLSAAEPEKVGADEIRGQKIYAAFLFAGVFMVLAFWAWQRRRMISCDEKLIRFQNGQEIEFKDVESLDLTGWDRGIAVVRSKDGSTAKIDDYKFEGAGKIVERLRKQVPDLEITTPP